MPVQSSHVQFEGSLFTAPTLISRPTAVVVGNGLLLKQHRKIEVKSLQQENKDDPGQIRRDVYCVCEKEQCAKLLLAQLIKI